MGNHQSTALNAVFFCLFRCRIRQAGKSLLHAQRLAHFADGAGRGAFHYQLDMQRTSDQRLHFAQAAVFAQIVKVFQHKQRG